MKTMISVAVLCLTGCLPAKYSESYDVGTCHANDEYDVVVKVKERLEHGLKADAVDREGTMRLHVPYTNPREIYVTYDMIDGSRGYRSSWFRQVDCLLYDESLKEGIKK